MKHPEDDTNPELDWWLNFALKHTWPTDAKPHIRDDALLIPHAYFHDFECRHLKSIEWVTVRSREELLKALGYGPLFD